MLLPGWRGFLLAGWFWCGCAIAVEDQSAATAQQLFSDMVRAVHERDYVATMVYLLEGQLGSMRFYHRNWRGDEWEYLSSLSGPENQMTRRYGGMNCIDKVHSNPMGQVCAVAVLPGLDVQGAAQLRDGYDFLLLGSSRIAGRAARVIAVIPRDRMRYGYRFYLDQQTALPLKTDVMDTQAEPVQQIMVTELDLDPDWQDPANPLAEENLSAQAAIAPTPAPDEQRTHWAIGRLPALFQVRSHQIWNSDEAHAVEHFLLSDGLASFSVYLERTGAGSEGAEESKTHRIGAISIMTRRRGAQLITGVGKVPAETMAFTINALAPARETIDDQ